MCGIIGYTGTANAVPKMMKGLSVLEYRGYDSVGIAAEVGDGTRLVKCKGRIGVLEEKLRDAPIEGSSCAIGHTRWATHGAPSDANAHPHRAGRVMLVHNGIIENYKPLREALEKTGVTFLSQTDTEVAAALIDACFCKTGDPVAAIREATEQMRGAYAFGILFDGYRDTIYAVRRGSPLILARGQDGYYIASDMTALLPFTREYHPMREGEIVCFSKGAAVCYDEKNAPFTPVFEETTMSPESAQKGGFAHFMLKEIYEQPRAAAGCVSPRVSAAGLPDFSVDGVDADFLRSVRQVQIVACGSAVHAGYLGARYFEDLAGVPASVFVASEYRYHPPLTGPGTLVLLISQSGETADTLAALRYAKEKGLPTLAIVNAVETTIAREADRRVYTYAGPEIAVATTKGYCTQVATLWALAAATGLANGRTDENTAKVVVKGLTEEAPAAMKTMLDERDTFAAVARGLIDHEHVFYIGRGVDHALSMEAALKLKEISYVHCEAYAAGELKHGTISLVEPGTPVLVLATDPALFEKTESNLREVRSRGAGVTLLCREDAVVAPDAADRVIRLPACSPAATLFAALVAVQCIAYETAVFLGCDVDRPRNLAKSVTVE